MASLSTCHLGLWFGWQILLNLVITLVIIYAWVFLLIKFAAKGHNVMIHELKHKQCQWRQLFAATLVTSAKNTVE